MRMKNYKYYLGAFLALFLAASCEDQLNINENPNNPTEADVQLVLPQAIVASASISNQFNSYGGHFGGMIANAGGFSGFGNLLNYNLTPSDYNTMWVSTYQDPLADLKYVITKTEGVDELAYFNAAAKIMTVVNYQRLVDAFGNIPYSEALRADEGIVAPAYDDAATIYQDLFAKLDEAISIIDNAQFPLRLTKVTDPLFGELDGSSAEAHITAWKKYANTLKLRILLRLSTKSEFDSFVTQGFGNLDVTLGFLDDDAIVDPGYELNRPNPTWSTWGRTTAGALSNSSRIPTTYVISFYNGTKIDDAVRGEAIFVNFPSTPHNQLGNEVDNPTIVAGEVTWASSKHEGVGVLKGPGMGQPLMLAAEARFLEAEAQLHGYISGDVTTSFYKGIAASFAYLYKDENEAITKAVDPLVTTYKDANSGNKLVIIEDALSDPEKLEAIITQKYIALNMINSDEAWNEFRRTGYPKTVPGGDPALDIASNKSEARSRADNLPTRIMYPSSELSFNATNYVNVNHVGDLIFWDPN